MNNSPCSWIWAWGEKEERGRRNFLLILPLLGVVYWEVEDSISKERKLGNREKFLCFTQKSLKERETSKQVINNRLTGSPEPKQQSQSRHLQISAPISPMALSKPLVRDSGWLSCPNTQVFSPGFKISTLVLCSPVIRTSPVCFSINFSTPSVPFLFYRHPSPTFFLNP